MQSSHTKNLFFAIAIAASTFTHNLWASASSVHEYTADEMISGTTINLMWVYKNVADRDLVAPEFIERHSREEKRTVSIDTFAHLDAWAAHYPVTLWYDSKMLAQPQIDTTTWTEINRDQKRQRRRDAATKTLRLIGEKCPNAANIQLKDLRDLSAVKKNKEVFNSYRPIYFRSDLLRVIAAKETAEQSKPGSFFVYADFTIPPLEPKALMSDETVSQLNTYGIVMAKPPVRFIHFENSFQITASHNPHLLAAMDAILLRKSLQAPSKVGIFLYERELETYTFSLFSQFFKVFYAIDGKATFDLKGELLTKDLLARVDDWVSPTAHAHHQHGTFSPSSVIKRPEGLTFEEAWELGYDGKLFVPRKDVKAPRSNHAF